MRYVGIVIDDWCWKVEKPLELYNLLCEGLLYLPTNQKGYASRV